MSRFSAVNFMKKFRLNQNGQGITLVEALISLLVLSFGLIPAFSIVLAASNLSSSIRNNLIAANLAQEGVEVVRAMRDRNWFLGRPFDFGLGDGTYRVAWNSQSLLSEGGNPPLQINSLGIYNHSAGTDSIFKRRIFITKIDPSGCNCELKVVTEVSWSDRNRARTINVESHLFDWFTW